MHTDNEKNAEALFQLGHQQIQSRQFAAAKDSLRKAIEYNPRLPQAHGTLAYLLHQVDGPQAEAEALYRSAIGLAPGLPHLHMNLGTLLLQQERFSEAEAAYANAVTLEPGKSEHWSNLGSVYLRTQRHADAEACLRQAITLDPASRLARFNLSYLQLRNQHFEEGWTLFEARDWYARFEQQFDFPRWQGESLQGKSLLLCLEAGHGDVIQFVRYAHLLKARGARTLTLLCHPALTQLMAHGMPALDEVISYAPGTPRSGYDYWMPLLSAPYQFQVAHSPASHYAELPYLCADPGLSAHWQAQLPTQGLRVGLVWQGNPEFEFDRSRSLPGIQALRPLWSIEGVAFVSLQKGAGETQAQEFSQTHALTCLGHQIRDFADTAAIMAQLDLVISVDSANAHLAGALGKPCWMLLPDYMCDWRWGASASHSDWYPGVLRLFRQGADARWEPVIEAVRGALAEQARLQKSGPQRAQRTL
jgi:Tfp pilus assembly protein PilF